MEVETSPVFSCHSRSFWLFVFGVARRAANGDPARFLPAFETLVITAGAAVTHSCFHEGGFAGGLTFHNVRGPIIRFRVMGRYPVVTRRSYGDRGEC